MATVTDITELDLPGIPGIPGSGVSAANWASLLTVVNISTGVVTIQGNNEIYSGGSGPEGVVTGSPGDIFLKTSGVTGLSLWSKVSGAATTTGWVQVDGFARARWESGVRHNPGAATVSTVGSTAWTLAGTLTANPLTSGSFLNMATAASSNAVSTANGPTAYRSDWGVDATFRLAIVDNTNLSIWAGLFSGDPSASATPSVETAAFRFDTANDTNWRARWRDATTGGGTDTGIVPAAGSYYLRITLDGTTARWYINDAFVAEQATNIPQSTTTLAPWVSIRTLNSTIRNVGFAWANLMTR